VTKAYEYKIAINEINAKFDLKKSTNLEVKLIEKLTVEAHEIKSLLIKTIKTQLIRISHSSKNVKPQLTEKIKTQLIKKIKILLIKMIKTHLIACHTQSNIRLQK
jgi:hypothetical protein